MANREDTATFTPGYSELPYSWSRATAIPTLISPMLKMNTS